MITLPALFVLLTFCAAVYSVTMVMRYHDSKRQWLRGSGLDLTIIAFLILFSLRYVVVYVHLQNKGLKYLDTIYWSLYFLGRPFTPCVHHFRLLLTLCAPYVDLMMTLCLYAYSACA